MQCDELYRAYHFTIAANHGSSQNLNPEPYLRLASRSSVTKRVCSSGKAFPMLQKPMLLVLAILLQGVACPPASAAEREDVRKVVNLVTSVKMPYPESLTRNRAKTE